MLQFKDNATPKVTDSTSLSLNILNNTNTLKVLPISQFPILITYKSES